MTRYRFSVKAQLSSRPRVVAELTSACREVGHRPATDSDKLDLHDPFDAAIVSAVSEVINNIVLHGYGGHSDDEVQFEIDASEHGITVRITDWGEPSEQIGPKAGLPPLPEGGMGFHLIHVCVDRVDYQPGPPNTWTLEKRYPTGDKSGGNDDRRGS